MKKVYLKIFLVLSLSLTIFILVGAMSASATMPNEEVGNEVDDLAAAVTPGGGGGYQNQYGGGFENQYQGDNGEGYTYTHEPNEDSEYHHAHQWESKK